MFKIGALEKLIHELNRLPGVGPKTAQRLAYHILRTPDFSDKLQGALKQVQENVHLCAQCFSYTDEPQLCRYCSDSNRRTDLLCIVEQPSDILRVESSGVFRGAYHVLHGAISPLDNIGPQDLRINELIDRIDAGIEGRAVTYLDAQQSTAQQSTAEQNAAERNDSHQNDTQTNSTETDGSQNHARTDSKIAPRVREVILALDPDLEGDTTVLYLAKVLSAKQVKITRIASGVPLGSDIDYVDDRTLGRALENRIEL